MSFSLSDLRTLVSGSYPTTYSEVPNRTADRNKRAGLEKNATLLAYLLSK